MKKISFLVLASLLFCISVTFAQASKTPLSASVPQNQPALKWKTTNIDMGKIPQGKPATVTFEFKNTGKIPVVLKNVHPGCGCTTAGYTKEPIEPGKMGNVKATYNAAAIGPFAKSISVTADNDETASLIIQGEVIATPTPPAGK